MELVQLKYFVATAHQMHFAMTAQDLGITQPALSNSIHSLEKELGFHLFDRSNKRKIFLTPAGETFLVEAEKILSDLKNAQKRAKEAATGNIGHLSIGALSSALGRREVLDALVYMQKKYPDISLEVVDDNSKGLSEKMQENALDLVLTRFDQSLFDNSDLRYEQIYLDELFFVFRNDHPLALKEDLAVEDLRNEHFILVPQSTSPTLNAFVRQVCETKGGFSPKVLDESSSSFTALRLVEAGMGITVVPAAYHKMFPERLIYRRFPQNDLALPVYAVYPTKQSSSIRHKFLTILKQSFQKTGPFAECNQP